MHGIVLPFARNLTKVGSSYWRTAFEGVASLVLSTLSHTGHTPWNSGSKKFAVAQSLLRAYCSTSGCSNSHSCNTWGCCGNNRYTHMLVHVGAPHPLQQGGVVEQHLRAAQHSPEQHQASYARGGLSIMSCYVPTALHLCMSRNLSRRASTERHKNRPTRR